MNRERLKKRLKTGIFLGLAVCFGLAFLFSAFCAVACFDGAWRVQELYPWAVSKAEPGWESAMYTLEEKQEQWLMGGVVLGFCGLLSLGAGVFLARRGWKRWREGKT